MLRRNFLKLLSALPVVGGAIPSSWLPVEVPQYTKLSQFYIEACNRTIELSPCSDGNLRAWMSGVPMAVFSGKSSCIFECEVSGVLASTEVKWDKSDPYTLQVLYFQFYGDNDAIENFVDQKIDKTGWEEVMPSTVSSSMSGTLAKIPPGSKAALTYA